MEKVMSISEAAQMVKSGDTLNILGGMAMVREIIRRGPRDLYIQGVAAPAQALDMLAALGRLRRLAQITFDYPGAPNCRKGVERGEIKATMFSETAWMQMVQSAGLGLSFAIERSMLKTDPFKYLEEMGDAKEIMCPFTGEQYVALRAPKIDVMILHAPYADPIGNVQVERGNYAWYECALIASKTIVTVEEIISTEEVMSNPFNTAIPAKFVDAVVKVPYGAHPYGVSGFYDADTDHLNRYTEAARDSKTVREYIEKYVLGVKDHLEYLELIGTGTLMELRHVGSK